MRFYSSNNDRNISIEQEFSNAMNQALKDLGTKSNSVKSYELDIDLQGDHKPIPVRKSHDHPQSIARLKSCIPKGDLQEAFSIISSMKLSNSLANDNDIVQLPSNTSSNPAVGNNMVINDTLVFDILLDIAGNCTDNQSIFHLINIFSKEFNRNYNKKFVKMKQLHTARILDVLTHSRFGDLPDRVYCGKKALVFLKQVGYADDINISNHSEYFLAMTIRAHGYAENVKRILYINNVLSGAPSSPVIKAQIVIAFSNCLHLNLAKEVLLSLIKGAVQKDSKEFGFIIQAMLSVANGMSELGYLFESIDFWDQILATNKISNFELVSVGLDPVAIKLQFYINSLRCMVPFMIFSERFHNSATIKSLNSGRVEKMFQDHDLIKLLKTGWLKFGEKLSSSSSISALDMNVSNGNNSLQYELLLMKINALCLVVFKEDFTIDDVNKYYSRLKQYKKLTQSDYIFLLWTCALYRNYSNNLRFEWGSSLLYDALSSLKPSSVSNRLFLPAILFTFPFSHITKSPALDIEGPGLSPDRAFLIPLDKTMFRPVMYPNKTLLEISGLSGKYRIRWSRQMHIVYLWSTTLFSSITLFKSQYSRLKDLSDSAISRLESSVDFLSHDIVTRIKDEKYYLHLFSMCSNEFKFSSFAINDIYKDLQECIREIADNPSIDKSKYLTVPLIVAILDCCATTIRKSYSEYSTENHETIDENGKKESIHESASIIRNRAFSIMLEMINESSLLDLSNDPQIERGVIRCCFAFLNMGGITTKQEYEIIKEGESILKKYFEKSKPSSSENGQKMSAPTEKMILSHYCTNLEKFKWAFNLYQELYQINYISKVFSNGLSELMSNEIKEKVSLIQKNLMISEEHLNIPTYFELEIMVYASRAYLQQFLITFEEDSYQHFDRFLAIYKTVIKELSKKGNFYRNMYIWETESIIISNGLTDYFFGEINIPISGFDVDPGNELNLEGPKKLEILRFILETANTFLSYIYELVEIKKKKKKSKTNFKYSKISPKSGNKSPSEFAIDVSGSESSSALKGSQTKLKSFYPSPSMLNILPNRLKQLKTLKDAFNSEPTNPNVIASTELIKDNNLEYLKTYLKI
ncbi:hypothetical protein AYI68_g5259 [Smittium mucronatum]|uniref:Uncharacterized protein n=1 Tax=Smittium mucronatum TaxID=133383 RepID=A0A1R0GUR9_9FUNG|nr:hypothetical protein AYI68_g5259 [Smittium mucronatum]